MALVFPIAGLPHQPGCARLPIAVPWFRQRRRDMTGPTENPEDRNIAPRVGGSAAFRRFIKKRVEAGHSRALPDDRRVGDRR